MKKLFFWSSAVFVGAIFGLSHVVAQIPLQGDSTKYITSAANTNPTLVSANPTRARQYSLVNTTAVLYYLRVYNLPVAPTCSSATGLVEVIPIPASASGAGIQRVESDDGQNFPAGMSFCLSAAVDGSTNAATGIFVSVKYKSS